MRRLKYMGTGERLDTSINPFNPRLRKVKCLTRRMRSVSTCCSSCFASEENDLITLSTPEVASEGEVNSRSEKDVQEPRQPTVLEDTPSIEDEGKDESQSALAFSRISLIGHQQNGLPQPTTLRENMKNTELVRPAAVTGPHVKANEACEPRLPEDDDQETVSFPPPSQPTYSPHNVGGSVKADEPTASPNTIGPLYNEAAEIAFWDGKSVAAHLLLKPTAAESSLPLPQQVEGGQENHPLDDSGTTDRPEEETAGPLQSPVEEVGCGLPTEGVVQRSPAGVLHSHHFRPPAIKAAMEDLRRMVLQHPAISKAVSAVCRIRWQGLIQFRYFHYGSGFFVQCFGMYVLLTCCHNFMSKTGTVVRYLEDSVLEGKIKWRCKRAEYHCSTRDLKSTVSVPAKVVLANHEDPVVVCDKEHDLLGILVNNPADFPCHLKPEDAAALIEIHPIPLDPALMREPSLHTDVVIIAHFPYVEGHKAECVELALGSKYGVSVCQDTLMVCFVETYKGSSGSPVLYVGFEESELGSVHRRGSRIDCSFKNWLMESYHGSSGSPVLYAEIEGSEPGSMHRRGLRTERKFTIGSVLNEKFLASLSRVAVK